MRLLKRCLALGVVGLVGCVPQASAPVQPVDDSAVVRVQSPVGGIETILLQPSSLCRLEESGGKVVEVSLGAFFSRWESEHGPMEQLALLIQLQGDDPEMLRELAQDLRLEMDGALYLGTVSTGANSRFMDATADGRRLSVAIPIAVEAMEELIQAEAVRAQMGPSQLFAVPTNQRARLRSLMRELPYDVANPGLNRITTLQ